MSDKSLEIFERFTAELEECTKTQTLPSSGDQDVQYYLELQQDRLKQHGLKMEYHFVPRGHFSEDTPFQKSWSDNRLTNEMECRSCHLIRAFFKDGKQIFKKGQNEIFYQTITDAKTKQAVEEDDYVCPNCGAVTKVKDLEKGCSYCGTFFKMQDLFPKVTNYFLLKDDSGTEDEIKHEIGKFIIPCSVVLTICYTIYALIKGKFIISALFSGALSGVIAGCVVGYLAWVITKLIGIFRGAGKSIGFLANAAGSEKQFLNTMKQHNQEITYEYFTDKIVSLFKMIMFSKEAQDLPYYAGAPVRKLFSDIVDTSYFGIALKHCQVKNQYIYATVDVYTDDFYNAGKRIVKKSDQFRMKLYRRVDQSINYQFSITKIQCKNCNTSFNAARQKNCPSCGTQYEIIDDDWIVTEIVKR